MESDSAVVLDSDATGLDDPIALFHTADGEFYCIDDTCTHEDASLAAGWLEDCTVECPVHLAAFCLRTGAALTPPASEAVRTYPVRVTDGHVWVLVEQ
nr:bifunctional 3-phenylpropionate/cinnamic acid dioxygenase ferredoxin subunit [Corynebacterium ciconiae]